MLKLTIAAEGLTQGDLKAAVDEIARLVGEGFLSGHNSNDSGKFRFDITGDEGPTRHCDRCGSDLDKEMELCTDQTCPFFDHCQRCRAGWAGHHERASGDCQALEWCGAKELQKR